MVMGGEWAQKDARRVPGALTPSLTGKGGGVREVIACLLTASLLAMLHGSE